MYCAVFGLCVYVELCCVQYVCMSLYWCHLPVLLPQLAEYSHLERLQAGQEGENSGHKGNTFCCWSLSTPLSLSLPLSLYQFVFLCLFVCEFPSLTFDTSPHTSSPLKHHRPTHNNRDKEKSSVFHFICCSCGPQWELVSHSHETKTQ